MSDGVQSPPPDTTQVAAPPPEPKPAEKKLLDELKREKTARKELEAKLAEAMPYLEKFKGADQAKELEAKRQAEAAAKARESRESRERAIRDEVTHGLISQGRKLDRRGIGLIVAGALASDSGIGLDDEGKVQGVEDYLSTVFSTFGAPAPAGTAEPPKKPAPGVPDTKGKPGTDSAKKYPTIAELDAEGPQAVIDFQLKYPEEYAALKAAHSATLLKPRRQMMPSPAPSQR